MIRASPVTRDAFENALTIAAEGKDVHGLYAVEDARAILEPIARLYWRQLSLGLIPVLASMNAWALLDLPWYAPVVGIVAGGLITSAIIRAPALSRLFAPPGYTSDDVARAWARSSPFQ